MHPDLSANLHTEECNVLINKLKECHDLRFAKFLGQCNSINQEVLNCLKKEREEKRKENARKANERKLRVKVKAVELEKN